MRPILIGMLNPYTMDPKMALAPNRAGTAGMRLYLIMKERAPGVSRKAYMDRFERDNLCFGTWDDERARQRAQQLERKWHCREVVLLGANVRRAFGIPTSLLHPFERGSNVFYQLPHPSGLCRWYNDEDNRARAADLMVQLYRTDRETYDDRRDRRLA